MTLSLANRNDYVGTGAVSQYAFTFKILASTDLQVARRDTSDLETVLALGVDYSVSAGPWPTGGTITLTAGALTTNYKLTIRRVRPLTQATDLANQAAFFADTHEDTFDDLKMVDQQQQDELDRCPQFPVSVPPAAFDPALPIPAANRVLAVNAAGTGWTWLAVVANVVETVSSLASNLLTFLQAGTGAVSRTGQAKLRDVVTVKDFGALGDGATNDATAFSNAIAAHQTVVVPPSATTYVLGANVTIPAGKTLVFEPGAQVSVSGGFTLTINGVVHGGLTRLFSGAGTVTIAGHVNQAYPQWWGAVGDGATSDAAAFSSAISACEQVFVPSTGSAYILGANVTVPAGSALTLAAGALLSVSATFTLTINGALQAPLVKVFAGAGAFACGGQLLTLHPEWWGALGDDATDDTAAITAAYTALPSRGGELVFRGATYRFTGITIAKPCRVRGAGACINGSQTVLSYTGAGIAIDISSAGRGTVLRDFQLRDIGTGTIGIRINCNEPHVERVYVFETPLAGAAGFSTAGIQAGSSFQVNDLLLRDVYVRQQPADGIQLMNVSEGTIDHCRLVQNYGDQIQIGDASNDANNINIVNGTSIATANDAGSAGIRVVRAPYRLLIHGAYFESDNVNTRYAIDSDGAATADFVIVDSCYFFGASWGANAAYAIRANLAAQHLTVTNCQFRDYATAAILDTTSAAIVISHNKVSGATTKIINRYSAVRAAFGNPSVSIANLATYSLGAAVLGTLTLTDRTNGFVGAYQLQGGSNAVAEISDPGGQFTPTAGTANRINVYYDGVDGVYEIENRLGATLTLSLAFEG